MRKRNYLYWIIFIIICTNILGELKRTDKDKMMFINNLSKVIYSKEIFFKSIALEEAVLEISKETGIKIAASADIVDKKIDLYLSKDRNLREIIEILKKNNDLDYRVVKDVLVFSSGHSKCCERIEEYIIPGNVLGIVTLKVEDKGIDGVTLSLSEIEKTKVVSEMGGVFFIEDVNSGTYILCAEYMGYKKFYQIVKINDGELKKVRVSLEKIDGAK